MSRRNSGGEGTMTEEQLSFKEERPGLGSYIWSILTGSGKKCRNKISIKRKNKKNKEDKKTVDLKVRDEDEDSDGGTFGIQKTEKLKCFVKPKPPHNRRRPTSYRPTSSSQEDLLLTTSSLNENSLHEIKEDEEDKSEIQEHESLENKDQKSSSSSPLLEKSTSIHSLKNDT